MQTTKRTYQAILPQVKQIIKKGTIEGTKAGLSPAEIYVILKDELPADLSKARVVRNIYYFKKITDEPKPERQVIISPTEDPTPLAAALSASLKDVEAHVKAINVHHEAIGNHVKDLNQVLASMWIMAKDVLSVESAAYQRINLKKTMSKYHVGSDGMVTIKKDN